jgi:hypothetical protein
MTRTSGWKWLAAGLLGLAVPLAIQSAGAQSPPVREIVEKQGDLVLRLVQEVTDDASNANSLPARIALLADAAVPSEYWLGISLGELPEVAKQQLGIDSGLVVADIMEDSPAAKAEIKKHDILIKAGDAELKEPTDLIKVVDASKGKEIALVIVRGAKDRTIKVAPVKRSDEQARVEKGRYEGRIPTGEFREEIKRLEEVLEKLKGKAGGETLGLWFAKPAVVEPRVELRLSKSEKSSKAEFPKDLSVHINKQGDQPTKVHVKQGDKEWNITEDKNGISLSELPDDIRPHVQRMLEGIPGRGASASTRTLRVMPGGKIEGEIKIDPVPPLPPKPPTTGAQPSPAQPLTKLHAYRVESGGTEAKVESKLDAIMKKLDQLSKEVDELKGRSSSDRK